jgi:ParB family chromosome partitioning protein
VEIHHNSKGRGRMIIHYNSLDELDGIIAHVK